MIVRLSVREDQCADLLAVLEPLNAGREPREIVRLRSGRGNEPSAISVAASVVATERNN